MGVVGTNCSVLAYFKTSPLRVLDFMHNIIKMLKRKANRNSKVLKPRTNVNGLSIMRHIFIERIKTSGTAPLNFDGFM